MADLCHRIGRGGVRRSCLGSSGQYGRSRKSSSDHSSEWETMVSDVSKLGVGSAETIRDRVRATESARNPNTVAATEESMEAREFRAEVRELRWADKILKAAAVFSWSSSTGHNGTYAAHRGTPRPDRESRIAPSTYDETKARTASRREVRNG